MTFQSISSKKFNNKIDYLQRKPNTHFSKKNNRKTKTTEKTLRVLNKQKDLKKIAKARKQKQERNMTYNRVYIRNGRQMYDKFDDFEDYNEQYMDRHELFERRYFLFELDMYYEQDEVEEKKNRYDEDEDQMYIQPIKKTFTKTQLPKTSSEKTCSCSCPVHCPEKVETKGYKWDDYYECYVYE